MLRLISVILLISMLPRMVFAIPVGEALCIAQDHISQVCHTDPNDADCDSSDDPAKGDDDNCIDLPEVSGDVRTVKVTTQAQLLDALMVLTPLLFESASIGTVQYPILSSDDPPSFCARTHSCCIAIRC